jgi:hypothetical protein
MGIVMGCQCSSICCLDMLDGLWTTVSVSFSNDFQILQTMLAIYNFRSENNIWRNCNFEPFCFLIKSVLGSLHKLRLHFLAFDHVRTPPSLHYLCSKFSIFLTTYLPLNANVICEGSLTEKVTYVNKLKRPTF